MKNTSILTAVLVAAFLFVTANHTSAAPPVSKDRFDIENAGALTGRVVLEDGTPLPYGYVAFFEDVNDAGVHQDFGVSSKRSPLMVAFIREDGRFTTQLFPSGSYFMGAVMQKRWTGGAPGKDQKKFSAIGSDGRYLLFKVKSASTVDIGTVAVREPVVFPALKEQFTVEGRVFDDRGRGVPESVVVVKRDINDPKGIFISAATDAEGSYQLKISPGKFFFVARQSLTRAGRPRPGDLLGTLGLTRPIGIGGESEEPPAYIIGRDGDIFKNVDITMFKVPVPDVKQREIEARVKAQEIDKSSLPADLPLMKQKAAGSVPSRIKPE